MSRAPAPVAAVAPLALALGLALLLPAAGCYSGGRATRDVNASWRGRTRSEIVARWGGPAARARQGDATVLRWSHDHLHVTLPSGRAAVSVEPGRAEAVAELRPGAIWHTTTGVSARIDASSRVTAVEGASLGWGPPNDANLRWGTVLGAHVGMGMLDDTGTPLPSGGLYIGGMLGPRLGLVGTFALASGSDDAGGAMGFAWGMAAQWWPSTRVWLRTGPALVLDLSPGFSDPTLSPGLASGASVAVVKVGRLILDLRLDLITGTSVVFGSAGVGINMN